MTRAMKAPSGGVKTTTARNRTSGWTRLETSMSETFRADEGVDEVSYQCDGGDQGEQVLPVHGRPRQAFSTRRSQTKLSAASARMTAATTTSIGPPFTTTVGRPPGCSPATKAA